MTKKPKILIFIDWYFPGYKAGGPVRSCFNMIAHLKLHYEFFVVTGNTEYTESIPYSDIKFNHWLMGPNGEKIMYLDKHHQNKNHYVNLLKERSYQTIMIMGLFSKKFSILPLMASKIFNHKNIVVSPRGMLAIEALKIKSIKKKLFLKWINLSKFYQEATFHVSNEIESNQVRRNIKSFKRIIVADNFPRLQIERIEIIHTKIVGKLKLVSVARIAPEKNTLFALEVLAKCKGHIELDIFGSIYDGEYWKKCKSIIEKMPSNISVNYKGNLHSELLFDVLSEYDFLFLPTRGENFGHIILESFMCGLPVIISDRTPWIKTESLNAGFIIDLLNESRYVEVIESLVDWNDLDWKSFHSAANIIGKERSDVTELSNKYFKLLS